MSFSNFYRFFILPLVLVGVIGWVELPCHFSSPTVSGMPEWAARFGSAVSVHASGRGNPWINLRDGVDLPATYLGPSDYQEDLIQNQARPLALTSADFNEDGVSDLVSGYEVTGGGALSLYLGNVDSIFPHSAEARERKARGELTDSPFLSPVRVFDVPEPPELLGTGDLDGDGHWDVVSAARGSHALYLLPGDGGGGFSEPRRIDLAGGTTALVTGEINRADGLDDVVVAVAGADGPAVLVFEGPEGALRGKPKVISVTAEVSALALGQLDDYYPMDLAVAAGNELLVVHGQDLLLGLNDEKGETRATPSRVDRIQLAFAARSLVIGDFKGDRKSQIALLAADGGVHVASRAQPPGKRNKGRKRQGEWKNELWASGQWAGAEQMVWARLSSVPVDNMVIIDQSNRQLHVVTQQPQHESQPSVRAQVVALEVDGDPVAVLPMRLNEDALHDLVVLRTGASAPAVVPTAPVSTIAVNSTADTNVRDNELTLREAILLANGTLAKSSLTPSEQAQVTGTPAAAQEDAIRFSLITVGTPPSIKLLSPLDWITDTVTIDGTTVFAGRVELDGTGAGVSDGLNVVAGRSVVRGLVINGFKADIADGNVIGGVGIRLFENGANIIEGNFLGTNGLGTSARGNAAGVVSNGSSNNIIGGNTASARNLISGNTFLGVALDSNYKTGSELRNSTSNQVQNNLVGTDMAGTAGLGNGTGAVGGVPDNHFGGVLVLSGSSNNTIARNVISGNGTKGVEISGSGAAGNQVQNNFIGTNVNGTGAIGNAPNGVLLNASNNRIVGNVISGNRGSGVYVLGTSNQLQANLIGVAADGTTPVGNSGNGVRMGLVSFTENIPANSTTIVSNTIAFNGGSGILLVQGGGNAFLRNSVHSNSGLGIQFESIFALSADHPAIGPASHGPTANDTCDADGGPNNLQNYPVLTSATFYRDQHDHRRLAQQHIEYHVQNRVLLQYDVRSFGEWRGPDVSRCCSRGHQQRLQCDH